MLSRELEANVSNSVCNGSSLKIKIYAEILVINVINSIVLIGYSLLSILVVDCLNTVECLDN